MNVIIPVSHIAGENVEEKEILINTDNIETIYPIGYTKKKQTITYHNGKWEYILYNRSILQKTYRKIKTWKIIKYH